ncbi:MAG: bis(5'-nucleosyl)-tetraphosphatase (symmetrical) YqeK [Trueperaceae bacterium]|nr:bis(5'-nucleosyl)-tetraphosphatase (symmetrical) YqeK [Trueperaceae bacterium]
MSETPPPVVPLPPAGPCRRPSIAPYCERVRAKLSPERFAHVMRVAELAEAIALANGFDAGEKRATCLAAVLHDVAREESDARLLELAPPENDLEREHPMAVHGRAGRRLAEAWGIVDERVLDAIEGHVFGPRPGDRIGMAVYVADVSEPGRGFNGDVRDLAMHHLERAFRRAVETKVRYLTSRGKRVHPRTLQVHDELTHPS